MRTSGSVCFLLLGVALTFASPALWGQTVAFPPDQHPWGSFPAGSWKLVRATSETLDDNGQVINVTVTDTRTTLLAVDDASYMLRSDITVDVAGRRVATTPHIAKHGYSGESPGQNVSVKSLGESTLTIDGRTIACELRQIAIDGDSGKLTSTICYSTDTFPYVLRRETSMEGAVEDKRSSSLVEVIGLELPQRVGSELRDATFVKTTQKLPQSTKVTLEVHCADVPGYVTAHWASETDGGGRLLRRSTLELIEFGLPMAAGQPPGVTHRRFHRSAKPARR